MFKIFTIALAIILFILSGCFGEKLGEDEVIRLIKTDYKARGIEFKDVIKTPRDLSSVCRSKNLDYITSIVVIDMQNKFQYFPVCKEPGSKDKSYIISF